MQKKQRHLENLPCKTEPTESVIFLLCNYYNKKIFSKNSVNFNHIKTFLVQKNSHYLMMTGALCSSCRNNTITYLKTPMFPVANGSTGKKDSAIINHHRNVLDG